MGVLHASLTSIPQEATTVTWAIMTYLWLMQIKLVNCTRQIMICEPVDIVYFTLGTGNFEF